MKKCRRPREISTRSRLNSLADVWVQRLRAIPIPSSWSVILDCQIPTCFRWRRGSAIERCHALGREVPWIRRW